MSKGRSSLGFSDALDDFDPAEWSPNPTEVAPRARPSKAATAQAAQASGFRSREGTADTQKTLASPGIGERDLEPPTSSLVGPTSEASKQRRRRTGRSAQFNLKARPETIATYCALADRMGWGLGETLERAVALLEREHGPST